MTKAIVKFNRCLLALLCSSCRVILKTGKEFNDEEIAYAKGELKNLPPLYCEDCKKKETH